MLFAQIKLKGGHLIDLTSFHDATRERMADTAHSRLEAAFGMSAEIGRWYDGSCAFMRDGALRIPHQVLACLCEPRAWRCIVVDRISFESRSGRGDDCHYTASRARTAIECSLPKSR